jgi:YVTN family beta-propeller protein
MKYTSVFGTALTAVALGCTSLAWASQAPGSSSAPDIPIRHHDHVYSADQFSNTVSIIDPDDSHLVGVIRLGDPQPANFSPCIGGKCSSTGWATRPITALWQWCRSARIQ